MSIKTRIILPMVIVIIILSGGLSYYYIKATISDQHRSLTESAEKTVNILSYALEYSVSVSNINDSQLLVDWLLTLPDIYSIEISNNERVLLYKKKPQNVADQYLHSFENEINLRTLQDSLLDGSDISIDTKATDITNKKIGTVKIVLSSYRSQKETSNRLIGAASFVLALLIIAISITLLSANVTTRSIRKIIDIINKMAAGDLSARIDIFDKKELGEIVHCFNNMAEKLQHDEKALSEANKLQKRFLSTMSHDLRSPLGIILSMLEITIRSGKIDSHSKMHLKSGFAAGKQLLKLIDDVLDIGKIEKGEEMINKVNFNPYEEIQALIDVSSSLVSNNVHLSLNFNDIYQEEQAYGDKQKIIRILNNLIDNSIKFTSEGSIRIKCSFKEIDFDYQYFIFEIKDTGIGITEEALKTIYEPFKQVDNQIALKYGGSGLGLSIVREYCKLLGGTIQVDSKLGIGTKFTLTLPLEMASATKLETPHQENNIIEYNQHSISILIIDDNKDYINILNEYLASTHYVIDSCQHGHSGFNKYTKKQYDIILLDCQMPDLNGYDVSKNIRLYEEKHKIKKTPILAITANKTIDIKSKCLNSGMTAVLTKPFNKKELITEIHRLCIDKNVYLLEEFI